MGPMIRKVDSKDIQNLSEMIEYTIDESYKWVYTDEVRKHFKLKNSVDRLLKRAEVDTIIVVIEPEEGDRIIGTGSISGNRIYDVYVHPEYQGNGIGISLMQHLENEAVVKGQKKVILDASLSSKDFYSKLGYKGEPKIEKLKEGKEYLVYFMEKEV